MNLQNRSTPSLMLNSSAVGEAHVRPVPAPYDLAVQLGGMRLTDPMPRSSSAMGYTSPEDPVPRSGTSMSNYASPGGSMVSARSFDSRPPPQRQYSASSFHPGPPGPPQHYQAPPPAPYPYHPYPDQHGYPQQHHQYGPPGADHNTQYYDQYHAAASDVLGVGPPPGSQVSLDRSHSTAPSGTSGPYIQHPGPYGHGGGLDVQTAPSSLLRGASNVSSMQSPLSASSDRPPGLQRSGTMASEDFSLRKKTKAIDLSAPPYTKAFVDDYRQRIKADPDPEAHFAYAKYLIEAAKKIGADSPDQRAVRKYRDLLITESLKVMRRLATQGDGFSEAQFFLANCYGTGMLGLQMDHERAYHLYLQAAKQNHAAASYRVAVCNEIGAGTRREHPRAFAFYRKAASLGDTAAMYKLGMILLTGSLGQQKNPREAIGWLRRAAEQADEENPHALHELGLLHETRDNTIVIHDDAYAKELFTRAAQLGYTSSQYKLGQCYEYGTVACPVDPRRSIAWYTKAAEKGDPDAELALSGWYLTGSEGVLKQSDSEAYLWARRAANKGLSKAEYAVGYYAEVGIGVKQDMELAKRWYMRAAAQGNKRAMNRLTELKRLGNKKSNQGRPTRAQTRDECVII
ncbi:hypothetical protein BU17DRAFT_40024 [Hysterangium stoloniferum]|nr:hypothetical protein BU17DRAFT_40024 [Hysterangium stoloniferum]